MKRVYLSILLIVSFLAISCDKDTSTDIQQNDTVSDSTTEPIDQSSNKTMVYNLYPTGLIIRSEPDPNSEILESWKFLDSAYYLDELEKDANLATWCKIEYEEIVGWVYFYYTVVDGEIAVILSDDFDLYNSADRADPSEIEIDKAQIVGLYNEDEDGFRRIIWVEGYGYRTAYAKLNSEISTNEDDIEAARMIEAAKQKNKLELRIRVLEGAAEINSALSSYIQELQENPYFYTELEETLKLQTVEDVSFIDEESAEHVKIDEGSIVYCNKQSMYLIDNPDFNDVFDYWYLVQTIDGNIGWVYGAQLTKEISIDENEENTESEE